MLYLSPLPGASCVRRAIPVLTRPRLKHDILKASLPYWVDWGKTPNPVCVMTSLPRLIPCPKPILMLGRTGRVIQMCSSYTQVGSSTPPWAKGLGQESYTYRLLIIGGDQQWARVPGGCRTVEIFDLI